MKGINYYLSEILFRLWCSIHR